MKKIFLSIILCLFISQTVKAFEIPSGLPADISQQEINSYLNKSQLGMPYWQALNQDLPFLLIFANSNHLFSLVRLAPIGQMVYEEFKGKYNFCILNTRYKENEDFAKLFNVEEEPALFIINTKTKTYTFVDKKYYNKRKLRNILNIYSSQTEQ